MPGNQDHCFGQCYVWFYIVCISWMFSGIGGLIWGLKMCSESNDLRVELGLHLAHMRGAGCEVEGWKKG